LAPLTANAFNQLSQYANSPGNRAYCYVEFAVSSLAVAVTTANTHFAYPWRDNQAVFAWVVSTGLDKYQDSKSHSTPENNHPPQ